MKILHGTASEANKQMLRYIFSCIYLVTDEANDHNNMVIDVVTQSIRYLTVSVTTSLQIVQSDGFYPYLKKSFFDGFRTSYDYRNTSKAAVRDISKLVIQTTYELIATQLQPLITKQQCAQESLCAFDAMYR